MKCRILQVASFEASLRGDGTVGQERGTLGLIFGKAQNKFQDPAKLRRLVVDLIDAENWSALGVDVKGDAYEGLQARWLTALLAESTGRQFVVQPAVVFPGWYVEAAPGSQRDVWVMEPKGLPAFLVRQQKCLSPEDIKLASFHLSRYVRGVERERGSSDTRRRDKRRV